METIIDVLKSLLPEIISAILGFFAGGLTVHFYYTKKIKLNICSSHQTGNNISNGSGVAAGNIGTINIMPKQSDEERLPELSAQAINILKQLVKSGDCQLVTFAPAGVVQGIQTTNNKELLFSELLDIDDDLDLLAKYGYLKFYQKCNAGRIFTLTSEGKKYINSLPES